MIKIYFDKIVTRLLNKILSYFGLLCTLLTSCASPIASLYPPEHSHNSFEIYVVSHGWHTGIVLRHADVPPERWPQLADFPQAKYIEVGWGDAGFYQAEQITLGLVLKAILWPTSTVLHVVGLAASPIISFPHSQVIPLQISAAGLSQLVHFIENSYAYDEHHHWQLIGEGIYGDSRFYRARGHYHLFHTCNHWTAAAIRSTGFPISHFYAFTAGNVMYQLQQALE